MPVASLLKSDGKKTDISTNDVVITAPNNSFMADIAAFLGLIPRPIFLDTFSTITIASSTTSPTEITIASKVN